MSFAEAKLAIVDILETIKVTNLIENPSFETTADGVEIFGNLTPTFDTTNFVSGAQSLLLTSTGAGSNKAVFIIDTDNASYIAATAGTTYTNAVYIRRGSGGGVGIVSVRVGIEWYDSGFVLISRDYTIYGNLAASAGWGRKSHTSTSPELTAFAKPFVEDTATTWASGEDLSLDAWMFNEGGLQDYVDGDQPGCAWTVPAQAHAIASTRTVKRVYDNPPNTIQDLPCIVIFPAGMEEETMSGWKRITYPIRFWLIAADQDWDRAATIIEAYRDLLLNAFDSAVQLGGRVTIVSGPTSDLGGQYLNYGDKNYIGMELTLRVKIDRNGPFIS